MKTALKSIAKSFLVGFLKGVRAELLKQQAQQQRTAPTARESGSLRTDPLIQTEKQIARFNGVSYFDWLHLSPTARIEGREAFYRHHRL